MVTRSLLRGLCALPLFCAAAIAQDALQASDGTQAVLADVGRVLGRISLNDAVEPFERTLGEEDEFGAGMASLGDLNGDGLLEFAVGAPGDSQGRGAVWIFSLTTDRRIRKFVKLGPVENLPFTLAIGDRFGTSVTTLGDLDGNGFPELAVGAPGDDDGLVPPFTNAGALWVLFLGPGATIESTLKISRTSAFPGVLAAGDAFGTSVAKLGDLDGNGTPDLAVGAPGNNEQGADTGALWILFFAPDRSILAVQKISATQGGLVGPLAIADRLASGLALLGDQDGNGTPELAASAPGGDAIWILSLASNGTVAAETHFTITRAMSLASPGDLNGDGATDLAVGAPRPAGSGDVCFVVLLRPDGSPLSSASINSPFPGIKNGFGTAVAAPGDTDGDGLQDLVVGAPSINTRVENSGALAFFNLAANGAQIGSPRIFDAATSSLPIAPTFIRGDDEYGKAIASLGDLNGDGFAEVAVGAPSDDDLYPDAGAVWIHYLTATSGTRVAKLSATQSALPLLGGSGFGTSLAALHDLNGDGTPDLAVGVPGQHAIFVLFLRPNGDLDSFQKITDSHFDFGGGLAAIGDLDGDGTTDLAAASSGRIVVCFLNRDGTAKSLRQLQTGATTFSLRMADMGQPSGGASHYLAAASGSQVWRIELDPAANVVSTVSHAAAAGAPLASIGDLDGDGNGDLAQATVGGSFRQINLQFLGASFAIHSVRTFPAGKTYSLSTLGDLSGDGVPDLGGAVRFGRGSRVVLYQLGGSATRNFELQDDARMNRLENGRSIPNGYVGRLFTLSSGGANRGAAIFNSNPNGPNQGNDMLVGRDNVLILQDDAAPAQSSPGIFAHPHDDPDGGVLAFAFHGPVQALALTLIDLDPPPNRGAIVTLFDSANHTRTYTVPPGWTGGFGAPGARKLELFTLAPQAGAGPAFAFASQSPLFTDRDVVRLEVELFNGGALDDLVFDPYP